MKYFLIIFYFILSVLYGKGPVDQEIQNNSVKIKTISIRNGDFDGIYLFSSPKESEPSLLSFNRFRRSPSINYEGPFPIIFYHLKPQNPSILNPIRVPIASFTPPDGSNVKEWLLFFDPVQNPQPGEPLFRVLGMDDSLSAFPVDHGIIFNATTIEFSGIIDDAKYKIPIGPGNVFELKDSTRTALAIQRQGTPIVVFENTFTFRKGTRTIIMIRPPTRKGSLRVEGYIIQESVTESAETPKN
jgi:hypothetical protein